MKFKDTRHNRSTRKDATPSLFPARFFDAHCGDTPVRFSNLVAGAWITGPGYTKLYSAKGWKAHQLPRTGFAPLLTAKEAKMERERIYEWIMERRSRNGTAAVWGIEALDAFLDVGHIIELIHLQRENGVKLKVQLTYNHQNHLATGCRTVTEKNGVWFYDQTTGLSELGKMIVRLLAKNQIIVDVSHLNRASALEVCQAAYPIGLPAIASHANSRVVFSSKNGLPKREDDPFAIRALDDTVILAVLESGGFVGITPHPYLLFGKRGEEVVNGTKNPTLLEIVRHLEHVRRIARRYGKNASRSLALASDSELNAQGGLVLPAGYDEQTYPRLFLDLSELLRERNLSGTEIEALMGGNATRVFGI